MLHGNPMTVSQIARLVDESPSRIADDLNHFLRSLKHTEYKAIVEPAVVAPAGSSSQARNSPSPPGCPECHSTWVYEPKIGIEGKTRSDEPPSQ